MIQSVIMYCIAMLCGVSAAEWFIGGAYAAGMTFVGFGVGYLALASVFAK